MHINELTRRIIAAAIEVHRHLGPGLSEGSYEVALTIELTARGLRWSRQTGFPVTYKGRVVGRHRPDLIVEEAVVVEVKAVERLARVHTAQAITYLQVTGCEVALVLNFGASVLKDGIHRVVLQRGHRTL
jgi:GxxExxY protein